MDHVRLDVDPELDDAGVAAKGLAVPIEAKLRLLSVQLLYEVCRVQKLSLTDLRIFDDQFIEHLFELVPIAHPTAETMRKISSIAPAEEIGDRTKGSFNVLAEVLILVF